MPMELFLECNERTHLNSDGHTVLMQAGRGPNTPSHTHKQGTTKGLVSLVGVLYDTTAAAHSHAM